MNDRVGQQVGSYRLIRLLGRGGFADVYLGEHIHLGTEAAIKILQTRLLENDIASFRNEARIIAELKHSNIVALKDYGVENAIPFLVMEYAPNGTLRMRHSRGAILSPLAVLSYVKQTAAALQYAHSRNLVHCDIKPENMLVGRNDEILLTDFGLAVISQSVRAESQKTLEMAGTVFYMAPEQFQGHPRTASDQYALGGVLYEWLTGTRPFNGASFTEIAMQHMSAPPPLLRSKVPTIPAAVEEVVLRALAKAPEQRFLNIEAFASAFEQATTSSAARAGQAAASSMSGLTMADESRQAKVAMESSTRARLVGPSGPISLSANRSTIGRARDNDVVTEDDQVSSHHAEILFNGQTHAIVDGGSTNGTYINEQLIEQKTPRPLNHGDIIRVGKTRYAYDASSGSQPQNASSDGKTVFSPPPSSPAPIPVPVQMPPYPGLPGHSAYGFAPLNNSQGTLPASSFVPPQPPANRPPAMPASNAGNVSAVYPAGPAFLQDSARPGSGQWQYSAVQQQMPPVNAVTPLPTTPFKPSPDQQRRRRLILYSCIAAVLVIAGAITSYFLYSSYSTSSAQKSMLDTFCNSLMQGDYQNAYNQLSSGLQGRVSEELFASFYPGVASCHYTSITSNGNSATAGMAITGPNLNENEDATLIQDTGNNNAWRIDSIPNLSTVAKTLQAYCDEIRNHNFSTAYEQLSQAERRNASPTALATHYQGVNTCTVSNVDNSSGHGTINYVVVNSTGASVTAIADYDLVLENGIWKIDQEHLR